MSMNGAAVQRVQLPAVPASPGDARRFVGAALSDSGHGGLLLDVAILLTSELVTNAVRYAVGNVDVAVRWVHDWVRVEVGDQSPVPPLPRDVRPDDTTGRGLHLVASLAGSWGVDPQEDDGKVVWFELSA